MIRPIFVKIYIYTFLSYRFPFLSYYHLFGLLVNLVHKFITSLTYLSNILRYFVSKDKMFSRDGVMIT